MGSVVFQCLPPQPDLVGDVVELPGAHPVQLLAPLREPLADLMAFSVIASWVPWDPPTGPTFLPVVTRLWPSESMPTPRSMALEEAVFFWRACLPCGEVRRCQEWNKRAIYSGA
jgi:hypothetical protein